MDNKLNKRPKAERVDAEIKSPKLMATSKHLKSIFSAEPSVTNKELPTKFSMIPTRKKNVTEIKPFTLSHTLKNRAFVGIRKKSKTSLDMTSNNGDTLSQDGSITNNRPSSSRISTTRDTTFTNLAGMKSHKVGEIPKYLSKDRGAVEITLASKKKNFAVLKKKLVETQSEFLKAYKSVQEAQIKVNKVLGKEATKDFHMEQIDMVAIVNEDGKLLMVNEEDRLKDIRKKANVNPEVQHKILNMSDAGFKLCREILNNFGKTHFDAQKIGEKCFTDKTMNEILKKMEERVDFDYKAHLMTIKEIMQNTPSSIDPSATATAAAAPAQAPAPPPTAAQSPPDPDQIEQIAQLKKSLETYKAKCDKLESQLKDVTVKECDLGKDVLEKDNMINVREQDITRLKNISQSLEEHKAAIEIKYETLEKKYEFKIQEFNGLQSEFDDAQSKIQAFEDAMAEAKCEQQKLQGYISREQEVTKLFEIEVKKCEHLQSDLERAETELENVIHEFDTLKKSTALGAGDRIHNEDQMWNELQAVKMNLEKVIQERDFIEMQKINLEKAMENNCTEALKKELSKAGDEISRFQKLNEVLRDSLTKMEQNVNRKSAVISEMEQKLNSNAHLVACSKDMQNELNILRESENERKRELEGLKCEIAKCHVEIKQQQETIYMHQRLLRIRSELINSLQEKEASNRCRMDDLYTEVTKKSGQVNQMNHEITAKAEELQNLFSTLGTKQMELTRQEHIIKRLEENNDRNQRLRVKQEEKICRLENEISELKNVIYIYQEKETKPFIDFKKINGHFLEAKSRNDLLTSSRDMFNSERRKKRQIEIEVKKIKK